MNAPSNDPRIGQILSDRYRIVRKIGDGGMGAVYEGEHVVIKRRVAIKVLHAQFAQNPEIVARFQREAEAATAIGHPNIVEVTDMGRFPDGTSYMVLEYLEGRDWADDIKAQGPQPLGKCVHILEQVCEALEAAHGKGIVHRDLKPENVFLVPFRGDPNFAKVLDFGISKVVDDAVGDRSLTQTGTALGTPYYMAPEQCQGKKDVDLRADIYSLGVMLFQALTAQYPFDDESYPMLVLKICTEPPPPLTRYRPDVPIELEHVVNKMLSKHRAHRFSSCAEVAAALAPFRGQNAAPVVAQDAPSTAAAGPSVLAGQAGQAGPAMTPTGTAVLQNVAAPPTATPYPAGQAQPRSNVPLIATVGSLLTFLVLAGIGVGAWVALSQDEAAVETPQVSAQAPEVPAEEPEPEPAEAPTAVQPATVSAEIRIVPEDSSPEVFIDGVSFGTNSVWSGPIEPGRHELRVEAQGFETYGPTPVNLGETPFTVTLVRAEAPEPAATTQRPSSRRSRAETTPAQPTTPQPQPLQQQPTSTGSGGGNQTTGNGTIGPFGGGRQQRSRTIQPF